VCGDADTSYVAKLLRALVSLSAAPAATMKKVHESEIQAAIEKVKRDDFLRYARRQQRDFTKGLAAEAKSRGIGDYAFTRSFAYEDRGQQGGLWPIRLVELLLKDRSRARDTNKVLMADACRTLGIKPFAASKMSKPPSPKQKAVIVRLLQAHGFKDPQFDTMTDVKVLIAGGGTSAPRNAQRFVNVSFDGADRLVVGTKSYPIEVRRAHPTGDLLRDRCARIRDSRTSLAVVMEILGVPPEQGRDMLHAAARFATERAAAKAERTKVANLASAFDDLLDVDQRA
jgi:hypothetical protein